jgi:hypothetical protein
VLADAGIEAAATTAVRARYQNNGQSCIGAKRFIVEQPVAERSHQQSAILVASEAGCWLDRRLNVVIYLGVSRIWKDCVPGG